MNLKLINEIANKCWDYGLDGIYFDREKFAELIVRECAKQVDSYWDAFENGYADKQILEHFGVE